MTVVLVSGLAVLGAAVAVLVASASAGDFVRKQVFGRPGISELGRQMGQIMVDGMRDGVEGGPRPDTIQRVGEMIESGMIRRSPFWDDPDSDR